MCAQEIGLRRDFDAFRDHIEPEAAPECENGLDDGARYRPRLPFTSLTKLRSNLQARQRIALELG